eukprot:1868831-Ditylum_brightwellii.AAC.1
MFTPHEEDITMHETDASSSQEEMSNTSYTSPHEHKDDSRNVHNALSTWFQKVIDASLTKKAIFAKIDLLKLLKNVDDIERLNILTEEINPSFSPYYVYYT